MTTEQVLQQEEFYYRQLFKSPESPPQETDEVNLIEEYLKQLAEKELSGGRMSRNIFMTQCR